MLKGHVSSRSQVALPKVVREQLGLGGGSPPDRQGRGGEVILRKAPARIWREWEAGLRQSGGEPQWGIAQLNLARPRSQNDMAKAFLSPPNRTYPP